MNKEFINNIQFAIPTYKVRDTVTEKTQWFSPLFAGQAETYSFKLGEEKEYYESYAISVFGHTKCKAGWDCHRHYEILANGCIPFFENINNIPTSIMKNYPINLVKKAMLDVGLKINSPINENIELINKYSQELLNYTKNHLTTKAMVSNMLINCNLKDKKSVLFISGTIWADSTLIYTLIGLKEIFGKKCHDYPRIPYIYKDFNEYNSLRGYGYTWTNIIDNELRDEKKDENLYKDIIEHKYDFIVLSNNFHNDDKKNSIPFYNIINESYKSDEIIYICGDDLHGECNLMNYSEKKNWVLIRELFLPPMEELYKNINNIEKIDPCDLTDIKINRKEIIFSTHIYDSIIKDIPIDYDKMIENLQSCGIKINPSIIIKNINEFNEIHLKIFIKINKGKKNLKFYNGIKYVLFDKPLTNEIQELNCVTQFNPLNFIIKNRIGIDKNESGLVLTITNMELSFNFNNNYKKNNYIDIIKINNYGKNN